MENFYRENCERSWRESRANESPWCENEQKFCDRLVRMPELMRIFGVCARTITRKAEIGEFPPLKHCAGVVAMLESDVKAYFEHLHEQVAGQLKGHTI